MRTLKDKKILLITLDSSFMDDSYVFPYLGVLYLMSVGISFMILKHLAREK